MCKYCEVLHPENDYNVLTYRNFYNEAKEVIFQQDLGLDMDSDGDPVICSEIRTEHGKLILEVSKKIQYCPFCGSKIS